MFVLQYFMHEHSITQIRYNSFNEGYRCWNSHKSFIRFTAYDLTQIMTFMARWPFLFHADAILKSGQQMSLILASQLLHSTETFLLNIWFSC